MLRQSCDMTQNSVHSSINLQSRPMLNHMHSTIFHCYLTHCRFLMTCVNARLDLCCHVFSQIHISSDPLLNVAYLKAAVILLLGKMWRFYAHVLDGNWLILYIEKLILVTPAFCLIFITRLVTLNRVRLSCLKIFFLLVMMNPRYVCWWQLA